VPREDLRDQPPPVGGQRDHDEPAIVASPCLLDEPPAGEVAHHDRRVAVAAQQLGTEIALTQRTVVQERLQHAELPDRQPRRRHHAVHPGRDRLRRPHQLDVGVEGGGLGRAAGVARRHASNLNGL
jgi:hypothetical protein